MKKNADLSLYLIIDASYLKTIRRNWNSVLVPALRAGVTAVQLRCKGFTDRDFLMLAAKVKKVTSRFRVPLIINDNVLIAKKIRAAGAHVGQCDMDARDAAALLGKGRILGLSASTEAEALSADRQKVSYIGLGPVFRTENKETKPLPHSVLKELLEKLRLPVVAIGGVKEYNIRALKKIGVKNFCFISEIAGAKDVYSKVKKLKELINDPA